MSEPPAEGSSGALGAPRVSVIIPVRNDVVRLAACLDALEAQTLGDGFEVVVVDNGSDDDPASAVAARPHARLLSESRPSAYAARNRGVREARGDVLAFTDADCLPVPDWLERGLAALAAGPGPAFVGGRVDVYVADPASPTTAELYDLGQGFPQEQYLRRHRFAVTANMLVPRDAFARVGEFSETLVSSGDREWGQRAAAHGLEPRYADDVRVAHPARRTIGELRRKVHRLHRGEVQLRELRGETVSRADLARTLVPPVRSTVGRFGQIRPATASAKARYLGVALLVHYLRVYEQLRLAFAAPRDAR